MTSDAYDALHANIVSGELSPGERLVEEELAEQLGQSRGAVRTALLRLEHDGLVVRERNRGARVRRVDAAEAVEILEARAALESLAAGSPPSGARTPRSRSCAPSPPRWSASTRPASCWRCPSATRGCTAGSWRSPATSVAHDICARLNSQVVRFQFRTVLAPGRPPKSLAEHGAIVDAIAAGDREGAEAAMRLHLSNVAETLLDGGVRRD